MTQIIVGIHAVKHALQAGQTEAGESVDELLIEKGKKHPRLNELIHLAKKAGIRFTFVPRQALERYAGGVSHQGVVARMISSTMQKLSFNQWLESLDMDSKPLLLVLDQVTDPHNLGACVRTAEAAGCAGVVIPRDNTADLHSLVVAKSACGALARVPVLQVTNLVRSIKAMQKEGFWVCGLAGQADTSIYDASLDGATALVMGAEGKGLRRLVGDACDQLLKIPMPGHIESLNVSVATGVSLFEVMRQRR